MSARCEACAAGAFCFAHGAAEKTAAKHAAATAAESHADLRTRFALALASSPRAIDGVALYDLADALAAEDARRREADGVR